MGGRREAELAVGLQPLPLLEEIEHHRMAHALRGFEHGALHQHVGEAGHALDALVGGRDHDVHADAHVERDGAEGGHGIDHVGLAARLDRAGDLVDRVDDARGGLAVDDPDMADGGIGIERRGHVFDRGRGAVALVDLDDRAAEAGEDGGGAVAIGAVGDDQRPGFGLRAEGAKCCLDGEGAGALHDDAFIAVVAAGEAERPLRISETTRRNSMSREPQSASMAAFTPREVVSGPGVRR